MPRAILKSMGKPKTRTDMLHLSYPLETILFRDLAVAAVEMELRHDRSDVVAQKNLKQLKEILSH